MLDDFIMQELLLMHCDHADNSGSSPHVDEEKNKALLFMSTCAVPDGKDE